jgi:hypothetical protein
LQISRGSPPSRRRGLCRSLGRLTGRTTRPDRAIAGPPLSELPRRGSGTPGVYRSGPAPCRPDGRPTVRMRHIPYCCTPVPIGKHPPGSAPRKANDRARSRCRERRRSPAVLLPPPNSPLRTASPTPVRSARRHFSSRETNDRPPRASGGDRWMAMRELMSPAWTRSGSRPKIMVARFVTPDRDLPRWPFASSEVRSGVRDRRLEWPPVRRVPTCSEPYDPPCTREMGGWSGCGRVEGRWCARNSRGPWYRSAKAPSRAARNAPESLAVLPHNPGASATSPITTRPTVQGCERRSGTFGLNRSSALLRRLLGSSRAPLGQRSEVEARRRMKDDRPELLESPNCVPIHLDQIW